MYEIKIYDTSDSLVHTIPTDSIISVDFSEREIESETALYRTPQRVVIKAVESVWLVNNIVNMPISNVADRNVSKFKLKIKFNNKKVGEYIILNEKMANTLDSLAVTITAYDTTALLDIYSDMLIDVEVGKYYNFDNDGILDKFLVSIEELTGFEVSSNVEEVNNIITSDNDVIATFDFSHLIGQLPPLVNDDERQGRTDYDILGRRIWLSFSKNDENKYLMEVPFAFVCFEVEEVYNSDATLLAPPFRWDVKPMYRVTLTYEIYQFFNITGLTKLESKRLQTGWFYTKRDYQTNPIARPDFTFWLSQAHGYDEEGNTIESWTAFLREVSALTYLLEGKGTSINNTFPSMLYLNRKTDTLQVYGGHYSGGGSANWNNITPEELKSITITRSGRVTPDKVKYSNTQINAVDSIKELLYIRKQSLFADADGVICVVNRDVEPVSIGLQNIPDSNIEILQKQLQGVSLAASELPISTLYNADYSYLQSILWKAYRNYRNRRELNLSLITDNPPEILKQVTVGTLQGYVKSIQNDFARDRHRTVVSVFDLSTLKFIVTDGVHPIENAYIKLTPLYIAKRTNSNGEALFFNVPEATTIKYKIEKKGYLDVTGSGSFETVDDYVNNVQMSVAVPKEPGIELTSFEGYTEVYITSEDNDTIYYTTNGSTPTVNSELYTSSFKLTSNKTVKAVAINLTEASSVAQKIVSVLAYQRASKDVRFSSLGDVVSIKPIPEPQTLIRYTIDGTEPNSLSPILDSELILDNTINPLLFRTKRFLAGVKALDDISSYPMSLPITIKGSFDLDNYAGYSGVIHSQEFPKQGLFSAIITITAQFNHYQEDGGGVILDSGGFHLYYGMAQRFLATAFVSNNAGSIFDTEALGSNSFLGGIAKYEDDGGQYGQPLAMETIYYGDNYPRFYIDIGGGYFNVVFSYPVYGHGLLENTTGVQMEYQIIIDQNTGIGEKNWL